MTAAPDYIGTLRGALSDWLYDPRYTTAPYEAQVAHADAIEAALAECRREGLGDVADDLSRGHGWEDTAVCWVWRLPGWGDLISTVHDSLTIEAFRGIYFQPRMRRRWFYSHFNIDWWENGFFPEPPGQWTIVKSINRHTKGDYLSLKSPEGLALLDTARPKVTP